MRAYADKPGEASRLHSLHERNENQVIPAKDERMSDNDDTETMKTKKRRECHFARTVTGIEQRDCVLY